MPDLLGEVKELQEKLENDLRELYPSDYRSRLPEYTLHLNPLLLDTNWNEAKEYLESARFQLWLTLLKHEGSRLDESLTPKHINYRDFSSSHRVLRVLWCCKAYQVGQRIVSYL